MMRVHNRPIRGQKAGLKSDHSLHFLGFEFVDWFCLVGVFWWLGFGVGVFVGFFGVSLFLCCGWLEFCFGFFRVCLFVLF